MELKVKLFTLDTHQVWTTQKKTFKVSNRFHQRWMETKSSDSQKDELDQDKKGQSNRAGTFFIDVLEMESKSYWTSVLVSYKFDHLYEQ